MMKRELGGTVSAEVGRGGGVSETDYEIEEVGLAVRRVCEG